MTARILLADDDPAILKATGALLRHAGYSVDCAASGAEAAELAEKTKYDLLMLDIHMPGNHNLELVRAHGDPNAIDAAPIMLITGKPSIATAVEAVRHAVVDYCLKPLVPAELLERVAAAINRGHTTKALGQARVQVDALRELLVTLDHLSTPHQATTKVARPTLGLRESELAKLSGREIEVLRELRRGASTNDIGRKLFISPHTVRNHLKTIYKKLDVSSRHELMRKILDT